jgi:hypothetical protein
MTISLGSVEVDKLTHLWEDHRRKCSNRGDARIELRSGGGIGTVTVLICGCGKELNVTDYGAW